MEFRKFYGEQLDSHGRQPRATATGDSHGRRGRATGPGDGAGRRGRATGPGDSHGRQPRATGDGGQPRATATGDGRRATGDGGRGATRQPRATGPGDSHGDGAVTTELIGKKVTNRAKHYRCRYKQHNRDNPAKPRSYDSRKNHGKRATLQFHYFLLIRHR